MKVVKVSKRKQMRKDSLPDIDLDFPTKHRDAIKKYFEHKYGKDHVCSVGAYDGWKPRSTIKDFGKIEGGTFNEINLVTKQIKNQVKWKWGDIWSSVASNKILYKYTQENPIIFNLMKFCFLQAKNRSIHASAVVIVPKFDKGGRKMNIYNWMPLRKVLNGSGQSILVSEWNGKHMDKAGFLKEDVLGLNQLDKFMRMLELVKLFYDEDIVLDDIPLDDKKVYRFFQKGLVEDVFQFSGDGIRRFCLKAKPKNLDHLTAMNALYRPGPMSSGAHEKWADILNDRDEPEYDFGLKGVTEATFGLYIYQEQIMQAVHILGGLTLVEADEVRTIMKKFDKIKMATFKIKFIKGAKKNGCEAEEASEIWDKLESFSSYGFNKSHSTAYSLMAYWSMWFKVHYPLCFWTSALQHASDDSIPYLLIEMRKIGGFDITTPSINFSTKQFQANTHTNAVYWSFNKIKGMSDISSNKVIEERKENGEFKSIVDFMERMKGSGIGMAKCLVLILSGCFDELYELEDITARISLVKLLHEKERTPLPEEYEGKIINQDYFWMLKQREYTGFGELDYKKIIANKSRLLARSFVPSTKIKSLSKWDEVTVAGMVDFIQERTTKNDTKYAALKLRNDDNFLEVKLWSETWQEYAELIWEAKKKKKIVVMHGKVDIWQGQHQINSHKKTKIILI